MKIRKADQLKDYEQIWDIFWKVIQKGDSFVFDKDTPKEALHTRWFAGHMDSFVAVDDEDRILGAASRVPSAA